MRRTARALGGRGHGRYQTAVATPRAAGCLQGPRKYRIVGNLCVVAQGDPQCLHRHPQGRQGSRAGHPPPSTHAARRCVAAQHIRQAAEAPFCIRSLGAGPNVQVGSRTYPQAAASWASASASRRGFVTATLARKGEGTFPQGRKCQLGLSANGRRGAGLRHHHLRV